MVLPGLRVRFGTDHLGSLIEQGVTPAAALAFLLAAPAINPIVLTATAVAFPNSPEMVVARGAASLVVAIAMGWLWLKLGKAEWIRLPHRPELEGLSKARAFGRRAATTSSTPVVSWCSARWRRRPSTSSSLTGGCSRWPTTRCSR